MTNTPADKKVRTAILISGRGSNMEALAKAARDRDYPAEIVGVISNRPKAAGLKTAQDMGIPAISIDHKQFKSRQAFDEALQTVLVDVQADLVCCAGFMRVLTPWLTSRWAGRMINIHPSLLPKYKGLNTHQRALDNGDPVHGCTVHYVSEELDGGAVIAQSQIDVRPGDTPDSLSVRLRPVEHALYVKALNDVANAI